MSARAPRLVFDVSGIDRYSPNRRTGIPRVNLEVASALADLNEEVVFCQFDKRAGRFARMEAGDVRDALATARDVRPAPQVPRLGTRLGSKVRDDLVRQVATRSPQLATHLRKSSAHFVQSIRELRTGIAKARSTRPTGGPECESAAWTSDTLYCSVGPYWTADLEHLTRRKASAGFRAALTVYDLIEVVAPQYGVPSRDSPRYFRQLLRAADVVLPISRSTEDDLRMFAAVNGIPMPMSHRLPIGSSVVAASAVEPPVARELKPNGYVLSVGNIELRKNQHLILDVWEMFTRDQSADDVPTLVVAGHPGRLAEEAMARLRLTPSLQDVVHFVDSPTDAELAWLYGNCVFSVYPARYEGWGLPVSESLDFGKLCLTSSGSSLPEAGEGLSDMLDPFDRVAWRDRVLHYWQDRAALAVRERLIRQRHVRVAPRDTATTLLSLAGLGVHATR